MKIALVSKHKELFSELQSMLHKYHVDLVKNAPDLVISHGGDGTLLRAERLYPGIPKLAIRDTSVCKKCYANGIEELVDIFLKKKFKTTEYSKVQAIYQGKKLTALNDIIIRNLLPSSAIRFDIQIGTKTMHDIIADGIVVASPFGSTGYFHSITKKSFKKGMGIAINNATTAIAPILLKQATIRFTLKRGIAQLSADNNPRIIKLKPGSKVTIELSTTKARILSK